MIDYRVAADAADVPSLWLARDRRASTINVYNVIDGNDRGPTSYFDDWGLVLDNLEKWEGLDMVGGKLYEPALQHGEFYPRIARLGCGVGPHCENVWGGGMYHSYYFTYHQTERQAAHLAAMLLFSRLADLLEVIEPVEANAKTFGHANRQLLILACTEVEAGWRGVLKANGYSSGWLTTRDYVKLLRPMRLNEWEVGLSHHNGWRKIRPFGTWDARNPTGSIAWYDAYNHVKHDREDQLAHASLENVLSAMAAVAVMAWASFGELIVCKESIPLVALFQPTARPSWAAHEVYYGPPRRIGRDDSNAWKAVNLPL